ncbi:Dolichyl-diphosphooligosaccharide--protein glycosyltransferase subunit WBP1 [Lipomyces orientalis]|uniref:Dolichyl-diphosphooligosaccharide--protein glycosyltransferase subunit WBP1 n=1 Tax=Lipomyces orientalis TaxID=1233043 RepID=A0ACC3TJZ1_9ASCO
MAHFGRRIMQLFSLALVALVSVATALSTSGSKLLVVLDPSIKKQDYSIFFDDLKGRDFDLDFRAANDPNLSLVSFGERAYDQVILTLPPTQKALGPNLLAKPLLEFMTSGGNILVLLNPTGHALGSVREFARELGIHLPFRDTKLVDHFHYDAATSPELHDTVILDPATDLVAVPHLEVDSTKKILYSGSGFALDNNHLLFPILRASDTAYVYDPAEELLESDAPFVSGTQAYVVAGIQARNNARAVIIASSSMLSDEAFNAADSANRELAAGITKWTFQETGVIKLKSVAHKLANTVEENPQIYRVKQDIIYEAEISEWIDDKWVPFVADDVQLEFTMLDPYYRLNLTAVGVSGDSEVYATTFKAPDQHGVFTFNLNYKRTGLSYIDDKRTVTLRHFGHNEFLRSFEIPNAYPYITSLVVVVVAWMLFIVLWVFSGPEKAPEKKTQ